MIYKQYKGKYDRVEFYSYMGQFFAERKYRKLMPYLVNELDSVWDVFIGNDDNKVKAFINYVQKLGKTHIGYLYIDDKIIENRNTLEHNMLQNVLNERSISNIYTEIEKTEDISFFIDYGFEIYKETRESYLMLKKSIFSES